MENNRWSTYESELQSYRSAFLSSQSIMLAVGAMLIDKGVQLVLIIACIAIFQIVYIWIPVIHYRAILVDFYKFSMESKFDCNGDFIKDRSIDIEPLDEYIYCKNRKVRKKVNCNMSKKRPFTNWRETRKKIDVIIPCSMIMIWIIYLCVAL